MLLASHGACSLLGIPVPTPYFLQDLLLSSIADPYEDSKQYFVHRLVPAAELSAQDQTFVEMVCGERFGWWNDKNTYIPTYFPMFHHIVSHTKKVDTSNNAVS